MVALSLGGTYFPPEDNGSGMIPWPQLLMRIADHFKRSPQELIENADAIQKNILAGATGGTHSEWTDTLIFDAAEGIVGNHDDQYGGFGKAPKFPPSMTLNFLRSVCLHKEVPASLATRIRALSDQTLKAMAHGGIYDQFGGGFARYSVDPHWLIPHFEKMLYDNALLIEAYTRGWLDQQEPLYAAIVEETVGWLNREMLSPTGIYYAALDADSDGGEGRYYVWEPEEIDSVLGLESGRALRTAYGISLEGNFEDGLSNPALADEDFGKRQALAEARERLREHREAQRTRPGRDEKLNTMWNCLAIRSIAEAAFYFDRTDWMAGAVKAADFIWDELVNRTKDGPRISAVYYEGAGAQVTGYLHDYATAADAFLLLSGKSDWYQSGTGEIYRERGLALLDAALELFEDPHSIGYYYTAEGAETPVARRKEWFDNAIPAGNSSLLHALSMAYALTGELRYAGVLNSMRTAYTDYAQQVASGVAHSLEAFANHSVGIAVCKVREGTDLSAIQLALTTVHWRRIYIQVVAEDELSESYQLCLGSECMAPTSDCKVLIDQF